VITNRSEWISNALALMGTAALAYVFYGFTLPVAEPAAYSEPVDSFYRCPV